MNLTVNNHSTPPLIPPAARQLIRAFDCVTLGHGDATAGMNTLVSMTAALSAAAGPDARVVTDLGTELTPGVSWLISGSLSTALHEEQVIDPLREMQNIFTENVLLARKKMSAAQDSKKPMTIGRMDPYRKIQEFIPELERLSQDRGLLDDIVTEPEGDGGRINTAARMLQRGGLHSSVEFYARGGFFHDGSDPAALSKQLQFSHRHHPLVDFPLATRPQVIAAAATIPAIMDGRGLQTALPLHVRGIATVRMPGGLHGELLADGAFSPWMNRMLWLTDTPIGPLPRGEKIPSLGSPSERYRLALEKVLATRLGEKPLVVQQHELLPHLRFIRHLNTLEPVIPGITGGLRSLVPTLWFGLSQLIGQTKLPAGFPWSVEAVESLATYLADRMAHAATVSRHGDELARRERWAAKICADLAEGPHTDRQLCNRQNKLLIGPCREVLAALQAAGRVEARGKTWHLVSPATCAKPQPPVIDVP